VSNPEAGDAEASNPKASNPEAGGAFPADVDAASFRRAAGQFASGIVVVSTGTGHAMTVSAFTSVSLAPPLVLYALEARRVLGGEFRWIDLDERVHAPADRARYDTDPARPGPCRWCCRYARRALPYPALLKACRAR